MSYKHLTIDEPDIYGFERSCQAVRLPYGDTKEPTRDDVDLLSMLVMAGDSHAKAVRGIQVYVRLGMQAGFMIEFDTYRHGCECLSSSSSMHQELKRLTGPELAAKKQADLTEKVYTREFMISYQAMRRIYLERRHHRHPDWQIFCDFIESLPLSKQLITGETNHD